MITNDSPFPSGKGQAKESMKSAPLLCPQLTVFQAPDCLPERKFSFRIRISKTEMVFWKPMNKTMNLRESK